MTARVRARVRADGDEGSALILALFFVTIFSLFVAAVISFAEVGLKASNAFSAGRGAAFAVDGAVEGAINRFGRGGGCGDYTAPMGPDKLPLGGQGVIVRCENDNRPASGRATRPVNALLSLGSEGISTPAGFEQRVLGNIFSKSTVAAGAKLIVQGQVAAIGNCTGDIQTSPPQDPPLKCANAGGGADPSQGRDPDYSKALPSVPVRQTVPACPAGGWLVSLEPGYYDDAAALSSLTSGACPGRVVWLQPGNYYLDLDFRGGSGAWLVDDPTVVVVGGTPQGWAPDPAGPLPAPGIPVPGSCQTDAAAQGVQLIAGGGTNLKITQGRVEVCATPSAGDQTIALYGIAPDRPTHTLEPSDWAGVSVFTDPGNATMIGESPVAAATAALSAGPSGSAALTLTGFRPNIPAGALIDSAALRIRHQDIGDLDFGSVTVAADFPGSTCPDPAVLPVNPTLAEDRFDLRACGLTDPAAFADLAVTYSVALANGGMAATETLDGIAVEVAYRAPVTGKPTTVTTAGFTNATNALEIGEQPTPLTADAVLTSTGTTTASLTVAGLGDPPIQPGSIIDSAVLRVAHREQGDIAPPTVAALFLGSTCPGGSPLPKQPAALVDDRVDLKASCGLDDAADLLGLTARYDVQLAASGSTATANLDGVWLELVYRSPAQNRPPATVTSSAASATTAAFSNPDNATAVGETPVLTAEAVLTSTAPTASLTFGGYDVPAGSVIESAVLRVVHQDLGSMDTPRLTLAFPDNSCLTPALTKRPALGEDLIDLRACGLVDTAKLAALSVTYAADFTAGATAPPDATARVDGVVLDVTYRPPTSRRPTTAITTTPGFINVANATAVDGLSADVTLDPGADPASVTVGGYDVGAPLPAGSSIDSAVLRVAHQDDAGMGRVTLAAAFTGNTCAPTPQTVPPSPGSIGVFQSVNLKNCGLRKMEQLAGLTATYTANPTTAPTTASTTHPPAIVTSTTFANPDNARAIGELPSPLTANAALAPGAPASISLGTYDQPAVPAGSTINSAVLRLAHQDDAGVGPVTATVTVPNGTCASQSFTFDPRLALGEDTIDLKALCEFVDPTQLTGLSVTYTAALDGVATAAMARLDGVAVALTYTPPPVTDRLDGIELDIVYRTPTFRPLTGCHSGPYPPYPAPQPDPALACALVNVTPPASDITTRFAAQGTIYAPSAALDISMNGLKEQVLTRGLVARAIRLGLKADLSYKRPLTGVPPEPVTFTAYPDVTAKATATDTPTAFSDADNALAIGEDPTPLTADVFDSTTPASVTLRGFPSDALPAGTVLDAAVLRIVHRVSKDVAQATVTIAGFSAGPCALPVPLPLYLTLGEEQLDLTSCGLTDAAQLSNLSVTYEARAASGKSVTASLDGITVDLLSGPLLRARVAFDADQALVQGWSVLR